MRQPFAVPNEANGRSASTRQMMLIMYSRGTSVNKSTAAKLTNAIAKWIATDCRPINIIQDGGLPIATRDTSYKMPLRGIVVARIHELYAGEKVTRSRNYICFTDWRPLDIRK